MIERFFVAILISLILLCASVFVPVTVNNGTELGEVKLGLPFRFVIQDHRYLEPPFFPIKQSFLSFMEYPTRILDDKALYSFLVIFAVIFGIMSLFRAPKFKMSKP